MILKYWIVSGLRQPYDGGGGEEAITEQCSYPRLPGGDTEYQEKGLDKSRTGDQTQCGQSPGCWPPSPEPFPQWAAALFGITHRTGPDRPKELLNPELIVPEIPPLAIISFGHKGY